MGNKTNSIMGYIVASLLFVSLVINAYLISHINVLNTYIYQPYTKLYNIVTKILDKILKKFDKKLLNLII